MSHLTFQTGTIRPQIHFPSICACARKVGSSGYKILYDGSKLLSNLDPRVLMHSAVVISVSAGLFYSTYKVSKGSFEFQAFLARHVLDYNLNLMISFGEHSENEAERRSLGKIAGLEDTKVPEDFRERYFKSQYSFAMMCRDGEGGAVDLEKARAFLGKVADLEESEVPENIRESYLEAQYQFAMMCLNGVGGDVDKAKARDFFGKVAYFKKNKFSLGVLLSCFFSQFKFANMCFDGEGGNVDKKAAREFYGKIAASKIDIIELFRPACLVSRVKFALMCNSGEGGPQNIQKAEFYLRKIYYLDENQIPDSFRNYYNEAKNFYMDVFLLDKLARRNMNLRLVKAG
ncbi:hypothetical protein AB751O23_AC_00110 [Chlamydiales bacterium SCGC AB-751-O23]|jgi:hypothetical protein|nr:hypothetical protein AB751O23_AC_00110 [Chlamydiales bacterium SCGC AB-751-O23]